jgi:ribosomal protein RSM22 (predicted rRNA methylase)
VLDFGSGPGTVLWALQEVWPGAVAHANLVEPSRAMAQACRSLLQGAEQLPLIKLHPSLSFLSRSLKKTDRQHDLVISVTTLYFPFGFRLDGILLKPTFWFLFPYSN